MNGKRFTPEQGKVYKNKGGGEFLCIQGSIGDALMRNIVSGWTFIAHGAIQYENGCIEWNYSTGGHFDCIQKSCRLCKSKFDFGKLVITRCIGEWGLGLIGGTGNNLSEENRVHFCPECGRKLTDEDFSKKE